jgi:thiamine-phosphate pyrophosphorylase
MVAKKDPLEFDLYPVTCQKLSRGRSNLEVLEELIRGGAQVVQLREKDLSKREFLDLARAFRERTHAAGMALIINDHIDVCRAVHADGIHLGQDDFPVREARELLGPLAVIGVSTHSVEQALKAVEEGADYINVGPIFATQTKELSGPPVGVELFLQVRKLVDIPITVMGGINLSNVDQLVQAGAERIAVVSAVVGAEDIAGAVREFRGKIGRARSMRSVRM